MSNEEYKLVEIAQTLDEVTSVVKEYQCRNTLRLAC